MRNFIYDGDMRTSWWWEEVSEGSTLHSIWSALILFVGILAIALSGKGSIAPKLVIVSLVVSVISLIIFKIIWIIIIHKNPRWAWLTLTSFHLIFICSLIVGFIVALVAQIKGSGNNFLLFGWGAGWLTSFVANRIKTVLKKGWSTVDWDG